MNVDYTTAAGNGAVRLLAGDLLSCGVVGRQPAAAQGDVCEMMTVTS